MDRTGAVTDILSRFPRCQRIFFLLLMSTKGAICECGLPFMIALVPRCFFLVFGLDAAFYLLEHISHPTEEEIPQFRVACGVSYFIPRGD